ncbi:helix-turn-helix transcriptional regulator [Hyphomicrobium sp. 2TAF46]|uniref:helix-turn-helix transcriptional regulator n=1 Tax=Hyphomicrobium sp. 2TAF46 TaxID=3233019 RepID=UPI003F91F678
MSKPLPEHVTRAEVAETLRLSLRQVDRLAKEGTLKKLKLSASRSGFEREDFDRYLQTLTGGDGYVSRIAVLAVEIPTGIPYTVNELAERLDASLCQRLPGCLIKVDGRKIQIAWNAALGYTPEQIL